MLRLNEERHCLVAEVDDQIVGTAALEDSDLVTFFVLPAYQRAGVGTGLLQAIEEIGIEKKLKQIKLEASVTGVPFYQKLGYQRTGYVKEGAAGKQVGLIKSLC